MEHLPPSPTHCTIRLCGGTFPQGTIVKASGFAMARCSLAKHHRVYYCGANGWRVTSREAPSDAEVVQAEPPAKQQKVENQASQPEPAAADTPPFEHPGEERVELHEQMGQEGDTSDPFMDSPMHLDHASAPCEEPPLPPPSLSPPPVSPRTPDRSPSQEKPRRTKPLSWCRPAVRGESSTK